MQFWEKNSTSQIFAKHDMCRLISHSILKVRFPFMQSINTDRSYTGILFNTFPSYLIRH